MSDYAWLQSLPIGSAKAPMHLVRAWRRFDHFTHQGNLHMDTRYLTSAAVALAFFAVAAHANNPVPDETIAVAKAAVERAEQSGAPQAAPVELASARDKLARAEKANADHRPKPAIALADQARIDAQVAEATALKERAAKAAAEFDASMVTLRQESNRASTSNQ